MAVSSFEDLKESIKMFKKSILKSKIFSSAASSVAVLYLKLVHRTSKIKIIGHTDEYLECLSKKKANFVVSWHGRIMITPPVLNSLVKISKSTLKPIFLASNHSDGQLISKVIRKFNFEEILGSTINKNKLDEASKFGSIRAVLTIMKKIKEGHTISIAPDGPRGPAKKINSEIVAIAKKTKTLIFPVSISYSCKKQLKTWDKFQIPFPFGRILIEFLEPLIPDNNKTTEEQNFNLESDINKIFENDKICNNKNLFKEIKSNL